MNRTVTKTQLKANNFLIEIYRTYNLDNSVVKGAICV